MIDRLVSSKRLAATVFLMTVFILQAAAQSISGVVIDAKDKQTLIGATVQIDGTQMKTVTDADGKFKISGLQRGSYKLIVSYISYKTRAVSGVKTTTDNNAEGVKIELEPDEQTLGEVAVVAVMKQDTEAAMVQKTRNSQIIVSTVSAQEISRTQDSNAGEVIRRVPGVSLIDEKFVMVRGLSQRYNNVWINGGAAPSSEADSRAFSFDLIPSSQIDNMQIVKTPSPEYPADYTGGFIAIQTKDIPTENSAEMSIGSNWNEQSAFSSFKYAKGSSTDFLGFDSGMRSLDGGMSATLKPLNNGIDLMGNGFNNDWRVRSKSPLGDLKLTASVGRRLTISGRQVGIIAAMNYTNEYRRYADMANNQYGVYDSERDQSIYLRRYTDSQYNHNVRIGAMLNFTVLSKNGLNKYQLKNIFNQIGNDRYTWRDGFDAQSNKENSAEYYYRSRTTYNGQFTGKHTLPHDEIDWNASYSFANRNVPDRRRYLLNNSINTSSIEIPTANELSREWTHLNEHIASVAANDSHTFHFNSWSPVLKAGLYGEYRTREYTTRDMIYNWDASNNTLPTGFRSMDITELLSNSEYFGEDKLYLLEDYHMRNNYKGHNTLGAGYVAATLPLGKFNIYAGLRFEHDKMVLTLNTRDYEESPLDHKYTYNDLFPSLNTTYKIDEKQQLRLSYGKTVNRPEFREMSPSVFYDFDLASDVKGNTELTPCYIQNVDLRYELYPSRGETVSIAAFYKYFDSPIEWTYTLTGGTSYVYSYINAQSATNYGLELDIRKDLSFIGLRHFSLSFNGAIIKSHVKFDENTKEENRPMQGQSPYLINTGLFYKNEKAQIDMALLYNRIGKRIIGVGRSEGTTSGNEALRVPDSYEMPRDVLDMTASKMFGKHFEVKVYVKDLLSQKVNYKQFANVTTTGNETKEVKQITRSYKPGRNFGLVATYKF